MEAVKHICNKEREREKKLKLLLFQTPLSDTGKKETYNLGINLSRMLQPMEGFHNKETCQDPDSEDRNQSGNDLSSIEPKGMT